MATKSKSFTTDFPISPALKATVEANPNIKEVHFPAHGKHYFNVYEHNKELYGHIDIVKVKEKKGGVVREIKTPVLASKIVSTLSRAEILGTEDK